MLGIFGKKDLKEILLLSGYKWEKLRRFLFIRIIK